MNNTLEFVGIGDLHLDGKLSKFIPDVNAFILSEVRKALDYAVRNGIQMAVFYGDICDTPSMSSDALIKLLDLFSEYPSIKFVMITGNHDVKDSETHSLLTLQKMVDLGLLTNVLIASSPKTILRKSGTPLRLLPWPHFSVKSDCLNVIHVETNNSQWDHGKKVDSERDTDCQCVAGHLHTNQKVGKKSSIHYSGTLYQTSFGERNDKFFHHVIWDGRHAEINCIPNKPSYRLFNLIISSEKDLNKISSDKRDLYKVFVKSGISLSGDPFGALPNVVKVNSFKTRVELETLIAEELLVHDASAVVNSLSVFEALESYMLRAKVEKPLAERAITLLKSFSGN